MFGDTLSLSDICRIERAIIVCLPLLHFSSCCRPSSFVVVVFLLLFFLLSLSHFGSVHYFPLFTSVTNTKNGDHIEQPLTVCRSLEGEKETDAAAAAAAVLFAYRLID